MSRVVGSFLVTGTNSAGLSSDEAVIAGRAVTTGVSVRCSRGFRGAFEHAVTTAALRNEIGAVSLTFKIAPPVFPRILPTNHCHVRNRALNSRKHSSMCSTPIDFNFVVHVCLLCQKGKQRKGVLLSWKAIPEK